MSTRPVPTPKRFQGCVTPYEMGEWRLGAEAVTDHLIDIFAVAGSVDDVVAGLQAYVDAGLDLPLVWHTLGPDPTICARRHRNRHSTALARLTDVATDSGTARRDRDRAMLHP